MNVTLKPEPVFTLTIGTATFDGMRQVSTWEGFIKLQGPGGIAILCDGRGPMERTLDNAFDRPSDQYMLVKASGEILAASVLDIIETKPL